MMLYGWSFASGSGLVKKVALVSLGLVDDCVCRDAGVVPDSCDEEGAQSKSFNLPVDPCSNSHL